MIAKNDSVMDEAVSTMYHMTQDEIRRDMIFRREQDLALERYREKKYREAEQLLAEKDQQLAEQEQQLAENKQQLMEKDQQIMERDQQITEQNQQLAYLNELLANHGIQHIYQES